MSEKEKTVVTAPYNDDDDLACLAHLVKMRVLPEGSTLEDCEEYYRKNLTRDCTKCTLYDECPVIHDEKGE